MYYLHEEIGCRVSGSPLGEIVELMVEFGGFFVRKPKGYSILEDVYPDSSGAEGSDELDLWARKLRKVAIGLQLGLSLWFYDN